MKDEQQPTMIEQLRRFATHNGCHGESHYDGPCYEEDPSDVYAWCQQCLGERTAAALEEARAEITRKGEQLKIVRDELERGEHVIEVLRLRSNLNKARAEEAAFALQALRDENARIASALKAYPDSDLVSLATACRTASERYDALYDAALPAIEQAIANEDGLDGGDGEHILRAFGYWPARDGQPQAPPSPFQALRDGLREMEPWFADDMTGRLACFFCEHFEGKGHADNCIWFKAQSDALLTAPAGPQG